MLKKTMMVLAFVGAGPAFAAPALQTVKTVDLGRYAGTWYEIASKPTVFQWGCVCTRQMLVPAADGRFEVYNSCRNGSPSGSVRDIHGYATVEDKDTNAKLSVDFGLPWKGDYWIISLDPEYRYAVVSDPGRRSLYVLSRTPQMNADLYRKALGDVAGQVDVSKLKLTEQAGCEYP